MPFVSCMFFDWYIYYIGLDGRTLSTSFILLVRFWCWFYFLLQRRKWHIQLILLQSLALRRHLNQVQRLTSILINFLDTFNRLRLNHDNLFNLFCFSNATIVFFLVDDASLMNVAPCLCSELSLFWWLLLSLGWLWDYALALIGLLLFLGVTLQNLLFNFVSFILTRYVQVFFCLMKEF